MYVKSRKSISEKFDASYCDSKGSMIGIVFEILIYGKATSTHAFRPFVNKTRFAFAIGRSTKTV